MINCTSCGRHLMEASESCPFCDKPAPFSNKLKMLGASATAFVMAACYGVGPGYGEYGKETGLDDTGYLDPEESDIDMDQFTADVDCDDLNPLINPSATEKCDDGIDNNCDGFVDSADASCQ